MMVVSFIFIPNIFCGFWVAFSIISIELGVVGYMALWKVNLDSISMINILMCIGFSVDFTAHICYAYMSSDAKSPKYKVKEALYALGLPIFQGKDIFTEIPILLLLLYHISGSVSTILGMLALALANNYIFSVFFKMIFLVVFLGAMHGLFLLPVLLSLFSPHSCSSSRQDDDDLKLSNVEKSLPQPYCIPHPQFTLNGGNLGATYRNTELLPGNRYGKGPLKAYGEFDKDLGLGTSEENSSQSSTHSNKKKPEMQQTNYRESWRRNSDAHLYQYRTSHIDIYGAEFYPKPPGIPDEDYGPVEENRRRYQRRRQENNESSRGHAPNGGLVRSSSYHNVLHPRYMKESRFP